MTCLLFLPAYYVLRISVLKHTPRSCLYKRVNTPRRRTGRYRDLPESPAGTQKDLFAQHRLPTTHALQTEGDRRHVLSSISTCIVLRLSVCFLPSTCTAQYVYTRARRNSDKTLSPSLCVEICSWYPHLVDQLQLRQGSHLRQRSASRIGKSHSHQLKNET